MNHNLSKVPSHCVLCCGLESNIDGTFSFFAKSENEENESPRVQPLFSLWGRILSYLEKKIYDIINIYIRLLFLLFYIDRSIVKVGVAIGVERYSMLVAAATSCHSVKPRLDQ